MANSLSLHKRNEQARALAAALPPLLVEAERIASTIAQGTHGRRRVGPGESFWQFRRYVQGDATARIDWRRSARSEHVFVRETEWEAAQTVWLWRDGSASMRYRSALAPVEKIERASLLLLALAVLLVRGGERVALLGAGAPPASSQLAVRRMALALEDVDARADPKTGLPRDAALPRHARLVLIGDFLDPVEGLSDMLRREAAKGVRGHLLQVLDPAEEDLPFAGRTRFAGLEGDGEFLVRRVEDLAEAYRRRMAARRDALTRIAHSAGWTFAAHRTDRPPHSALLALHGALSGGSGPFARGSRP